MITDPDQLYTAAIARAHMDPHIDGALAGAPIARVYFDTALHELSTVGVDIASSIVSAVEAEIASVAPEAVAAAGEMVDMVAGAISDVAAEVPFIGTIISLVIEIWKGSQPDAASLAMYAAECNTALNQPPIGSGYVPASSGLGAGGHARSGVVTPADIFAPDPSNTSGFYPDDIPRSSLGKALVGVTEADESSLGLEWDAPLYHTAGAYKLAGAEYRAVSGESKAGHIGPHRRLAYKALRRAMGAQNKDKGYSLWPIYMAMLADDHNTGRLSGGFMVYLLGHYWRGQEYAPYGGDMGWTTDDPTGTNPRGDGSPGPYCGATGWHPYVHQILGMVKQWNAAQASPASQSLAAHLVAVSWPAPLHALPTQHFMKQIKLKFGNLAKPTPKSPKPVIVAPGIVHLFARSSSSSSSDTSSSSSSSSDPTPGDGAAWTDAMAGALGLK